jgi:hypothetical protein
MNVIIGDILKIFNSQKDIQLAQPNFQYEKRQKELAKKKKQEEKKQRKLDEKNQPDQAPSEPAEDGSAAQ